VSHSSSYVWRYGVQHHGVDGRPGLPLAGRRDESCACLRAASRVVCGSLLFGCRPYIGSRVMMTEGWKSHSGGCGAVPLSHDPTMSGMVAQRPGWPHRGGGDGRDMPHWPDVMASSCASAG
jgi:hypothetical protein